MGGGKPSSFPSTTGTSTVPAPPVDSYVSPKSRAWADNKGAVNDARYFDNGDKKHEDMVPPIDLQKQGSVIIESIMMQDDATEIKDSNLNSIFLFGSPAAYFKAVEAILLVQCFYISIAATQVRLPWTIVIASLLIVSLHTALHSPSPLNHQHIIITNFYHLLVTNFYHLPCHTADDPYDR